MNQLLIRYSLLSVLFVHLNGEVYRDRPKIKTSDGDLILEPAYDKNIYLLTNGPKSNIYVGETSLLNINVTDRDQQYRPSSATTDAVDRFMNGPNGILRRLERLEGQNVPLPNDLLLNITLLWRRINRMSTRLSNLQAQMNARATDECQSHPCVNGGTCLNLAIGYYCLCPSNWEGKNCDVDVNECRNFAGTDLGCQNGAMCYNKPGSYECLCRSGWFGLHCTRKSKDCSGGDFEMCGHGTCVPVTSGEGIKCICDQGWTTNGTGAACVTDVNECESSQGPRCSVNPKVECINSPGSFRCGQCPPGYEGDGYICSDTDECLTIPNGGCSMSPLVSCYNIIGSRICGACPPGYQGDGVTCSWRGSCSINRGGCHPSAECIENPALGGQIAQCVCPEGMDGDGIGIHGCYVTTSINSTRHCEGNLCGPHGLCHPLRMGYTCICNKGFGGAHCDVRADYCANNPCHNGGTCRPDDTSASGFRCECTAQHSGDLCQVTSNSCSGVLDAEEGSIAYPPSNTTYNHNARCAWVIHTAPNKVINVTFSKFNLELDPECQYDFLQIHDGRSSAGQLIGRFCGNDYPKGGNIISSHNNLYFWFRSDQSVAKDGFALHWTSIDPICGGDVDASTHGHISSPGSPGNYPPNRDCYWHLTTTVGKRIQLHFFELDIEAHANCSFDYLAIYDGESVADPLLSKYCNSTQPAAIHSASSHVFIHFHSDAYGSGKGFQIVYAPVEGVPGCGGYFTTDRGEISSPSYDGKYLNNLLCEYKIKTSPDTRIRLTFVSFQLERSFRCKYDYLKIYDGPSSDSRLVGRFCGSTYPPSYISSSNTLFIKFKTDSSMPSYGFRITYESLCQQEIVGDSGIIKSPGYPFSYPENRVCEYIISTIPGKAIQLTFQDFDIEENRYYDCQYDNVEIRDGPDKNSTLLGRYCGGSDHTPPVQTSTLNYMYIRFNSDMSVSGTGFYANYTTINTQCGGVYKETTGLINHPSGAGTSYENDQSCTWLLVAPEGMHIKLTWNHFELEHAASCNNDYLQIIEIDENNEKNTLGKFCGAKTPPALITSTNRLMMNFSSDESVRSAGFSVSYSFLDDKTHCDGTYVKSHGYIYSPGWPKRYEPNRDCTWTIIVPAGQQIMLNITQFDLERPVQNICDHGDYLEIRNGATLSAPLIGKYCGSFSYKRIVSTANTIYIHFHSDFYLSGNGFKIEWDGTITGCGGTLTSSSGSMSSPNYPQNYNDNAECFYRIVINLGSRIRISFIDLDLEQTRYCRDDYVEIYDGRSESDPVLGRYCSMSPKLSNIETSSNYAFVKFRSDFFIGGKGFLLNYDTVCQNNLTGIYGVIESPDYPNNYPTNLNCLWTINVPKGNKINITFTHFDIYSTEIRTWPRFKRNLINCDNDYVQTKESSAINFSNKICGSKIPGQITTNSNSFQIKFVSSSSYTRTGFRLEWVRYGCGGHIVKPYGLLKLNKNVASIGELECEWIIETPVGTSVHIVVSELYMTDSKNCTIDAIEFYNGLSTNAPLLTKICHRDVSVIQASANIMLVKFIKRSNLKDVYFNSNFYSNDVGCGGAIVSRSGFIYSKNYPKNYDNNMDCIWKITVPINHRIELNFMELDLYSSEDDARESCGDFIKIYNTNYLLGSNYSTVICPNSQISQVISKYNEMSLQFVTNNYGTAKGFKANFTTTCGAVIKALHEGIIHSDKYIGHLNKNCTWTILAPDLDKKITLTITHMSLPKNTDIVTNRNCPSSYLRLFDGNDDNAPLIGEYCGRKVPSMIVSHGSAITIQLGTYTDMIVGQFSAHYSPMNTACGGTLTSEEGSIASPNYPRAYPVSADCEWLLQTSPGNRVYVTFEDFDLGYSEACNEDYLELRENDGGGELLGVYCGHSIPLNTTSATKLYIKFHSDNKNSGRGFMLRYGFLHGNVIINLEEGEIASPLYPNLYTGAGEYMWRVIGDNTQPIVITIDHLEIHNLGSLCYNSLAVYDGYDEDAPLLEELCGLLDEDVKTLQSSSNSIYMKLQLDDTNTGSLFHVRWKMADTVDEIDTSNKINCGWNKTQEVLSGRSVTVQSPNYPEEYDNDLNCVWIIKTVIGYHLSILVQDIHLEESSQCYLDHIGIYSSESGVKWQPLKEDLCLSEQVSKEIQSSTYMKVTFKTDSSITRKGFRAQVTSVCGGIISNSSGVIGPNWFDFKNIYRVGGVCEWKLKVRPGRTIKIQFQHFNITNGDNDCNVYVTLRNGETSEAPMLSSGKYCGYSHETRDEIISSSNAVFVSYKIIRSLSVFQNFILRYEEQNFECGATSQLDIIHTWEVISSPNYPSVSIPYSECNWIFTGPPGEILRIDFIDRFDLDSKVDCSTEFIEIRDGSSSYSPLKGRFCSDKPGTIKTSSNVMSIKYVTQLSEPRNGFKANISVDVCGGTIVASSGELSSPGYPHLQKLPYGTVCEWHLIGNPGHVFRIKPQDINIPESESPCATKITIEETLQVNNTISILKNFCGEDSSDLSLVETSSDEVVIKFFIGKLSEWSQISQSRGFRFTFNSTKPICGGLITTPEGYLTTPGYPQETTLRYCQWRIAVPDTTRRVRVEFLDADLGHDKHKIGIYNDIRFQSVIQSIPDSSGDTATTIRIFESSGPELGLYLWLTPLASRHRFKAKYSSNEEALCGGKLYGNIGEITAPALERSYTCEWHYVDAATQSANLSKINNYNSIYVTAKVNSSVTRTRCRFSDPKLNIRSSRIEGVGIFSRDLCGNTEISYRLPSTRMDLKATQSRGSSLYFNLKWEMQPCGGIIHAVENSVNILNVPNAYNKSLDCGWIVLVPVGSKVELKLEGSFQLDCADEFVKLGQGLSLRSPDIGDYCKDRMPEAPLVTTFRSVYVQYHSSVKNYTDIRLMVKSINNQCGGLLMRYENIFSSPNYPKSYSPNQECSWEIRADLGNRISLQFIERFVVEDRPNCTKDVIIIYDWSDDVFVEMARICGRRLPPAYNSTHNRMKVVLRTDADVNLDGFKAKWIPICGGKYIATVKDQYLYSPGYPNEYLPLLDCQYEIIASDATSPVFIKFLDFDLEGTLSDCEFDNVTIIGYNDYNQLYEVYCGSTLPEPISEYERISITLKTDKFLQKRGFKILYSYYSCGGEVKAPTILYSGINDSYRNNMNCTWLIEAPPNQIVVLKFLYIDLEVNSECYNDYVAVYNGQIIDEDKRLALMCGHVNSTTVLRSTGNTMVMEFISDSSVNYRGFKILVTFSYSTSVGCGGQLDLTTTRMGTIKSPLVGNSTVYEHFLDCFWTILAPIDYVIKIEFQSFHIASCRDVNQTALGYNKCDCDFIEIKDGINPNSLEIGTYCGHTSPPELISSGNVMSIRLSTDGEIASSGFEAHITIQQSICGVKQFNITNNIQRLKSPGYDEGSVPRGLHCVYHFDSLGENYKLVHVSVKDLDIRSKSKNAKRCDNDKFIVMSRRNTDNVGKNFIMNENTDSFFSHDYYSHFYFPESFELCGQKKSVDFYVYGSVTISLLTSPVSDSMIYKGFEIEISFTGFCNRNYTEPQGRILVLYEQNEGEKDCYTLITAPENHTISVYFMSISPDYWNADVYLEIFDGNKKTANPLIKIAQEYDSILPIFSNGRYLLLHHHNIDGDQFTYDLNYVTTDKGRGCGGKLHNELGRVTSPLYPDIYRRVSTCEWELETPYGTRLMLHFVIFNLGRVCDQNYVELVDRNGHTISTYCSETPADYTSTDNYVKIVFTTTMNNGGTGFVADFIGVL